MTAGDPTKAAFVVCVVDDDESIRDALRGLLRSVGYLVETFISAEALLGAGALQRSDCLVLDVHLPGMSGLDLLGQLRDERRSIPTVLVSARVDHNQRARGSALGALAFFPKPFSETALLNVIRAACEKTSNLVP